MPPNTPYTISGVVTSGGSVRANVKVTAYHAGLNEWLKDSATATTNSAGEYSIDLANLSAAVVTDEVVFIFAIGTKESMNYRHVINTSVGSLEQDIILHEGDPVTSRNNVKAITSANLTGSVARIDYYDIREDRIIVTHQVPANNTIHSFYGEPGIFFVDGMARIFSDTANRNMVSTVVTDADKG